MSRLGVQYAHRKTRCPVCDEPIEEGDPIILRENEEEWVHEECCPDGEGAFE